MIREVCIVFVMLNCAYLCTAYSRRRFRTTSSPNNYRHKYRRLNKLPVNRNEHLYLKTIEQLDSVERSIEELREEIKMQSTNLFSRYGKILPKKRYKSAEQMEIRTAEDLISFNGYEAETHTVTTNDGYVLTVHRIMPKSRLQMKGTSKMISKQRVILHHGLLGSSDDWLALGPKNSLPYLLSNQGYDVWLLNARGNKYSREHKTDAVKSRNFWRFSWHEMGQYDLPAVIKYIKKSAYRADTHYIGHSMGATTLLVLLSNRPEFNRQLKSAILLAPLAFMYHVRGPLKRLSDFNNHVNLSTLIDENEFVADDTFSQITNDFTCEDHGHLCSNSFLMITDGATDIKDIYLRKTIRDRTAGGTSSRTILHYMQLIKSGYFRMYDYGKINNLKRYYAEEPPNYNLEKITVPVSLISSDSDWVATAPDIATLVTKLETVIHHVVREKHFHHNDFIWSKKAPKQVFELVMDILTEDDSR